MANDCVFHIGASIEELKLHLPLVYCMSVHLVAVFVLVISQNSPTVD
jgi:hypothetical protein